MTTAISSRWTLSQVRTAATAAQVETAAPSAALSRLGAEAAHDVNKWRGTSADGGTTKNYFGGRFVESSTTKWLDVTDPVSS